MTVTEELTEEERLRRQRRKGSYHLVASKNKLPTDVEEEEDDMLFRHLTAIPRSPRNTRGQKQKLMIQEAKKRLFREIARSGGGTTTDEFRGALNMLSKLYDPTTFDARKKPPSSPHNDHPVKLEGMWITLSKPSFSQCLGQTPDDNYMYTLGRMSFDMFRPTQLVCSIQGTFNPIHTVSSEDIKTIKRIPKSLKNALRGEESTLRTYDIVTPFTIESNTSGMDCPNNIVEAPIQGLMTTYGYAISNPDEPNRVAVWFTGGSIEVSDSEYLDGWKKVFDKSRMPKRKLHELTCVLGAKFFMGAATAETMEEDGRMSYSLKRPVGGHDRAYLDMLYLDETVRIARSTQGVLYVCARVPYFPDE